MGAYCIQNTTPYNKVEYTWKLKAGTDSHIIENLFLKIVLNGNHKILLL